MKNECDIVQDLLFSYKDGCLKQGSKEFVEKHLKKCENCAKVYSEMNNEEEQSDITKDEIDYLKKIKKKMKKKTKIIIAISIILSILIVFNIAIFVNYNKYVSEMTIYLEDSITVEERQKIENTIKEVDKNAEITYKSKEDALNNMKEKFADKSELLAGYEDNNIFSAYYEVNSNKKAIEEMDAKLSTNKKIKHISSRKGGNPYELFFMQYIYIPLTGKNK
ncbi:MAG: permease-like cell division protein FtsX [Clostridium sp.]|nr:permease-like cell division protein FtsX [Clostridium sp.]